MAFLKPVINALLILAACAVGYYGYAFLHFANDAPEDSRFKQFDENLTRKPSDANAYEVPHWEGTERVNILLLGGDSRGLEEHVIPRSDTIMIASIDPVSRQAHLFSVLRDTYAKIPGHGSERINSAIVLGGPKLAMQTVSELTGLKIQYYVYTDFEGFVKLIDEIGGIDFEVEKDMNYTSRADGPEYDIHLKKGMQHMDGKTALQYVRFRHDAMSDYARTERQRKFLSAVAQKLQTTSSIIRLPRVLSAIDPYIETNLTVSQMIKLGSLGFELKGRSIESAQLPPPNLLHEENRGGASVLTVDEEQLQDFIVERFEEQKEQAEEEAATSPGETGNKFNNAAEHRQQEADQG